MEILAAPMAVVAVVAWGWTGVNDKSEKLGRFCSPFYAVPNEQIQQLKCLISISFNLKSVIHLTMLFNYLGLREANFLPSPAKMNLCRRPLPARSCILILVANPFR